jgi:hypothetical protein
LNAADRFGAAAGSVTGSGFGDTARLGGRLVACNAACAALAFFLASLAAFLLAFANFRTFLSKFLAARTCCLAASARATAFVASAFNRRAATARFARVSADGEVATVPSLAK